MLARFSIALLVVCTGALAASGGGSAEETAWAAPGEITAQQVRDYAGAVNLREGDLPDAIVAPPTDEISIDDARFIRCAGAPQQSERVARVRSETLELDRGPSETDFYSAVEALPIPAETAERLEVFQSRRGFRCLRRILTKAMDAMKSGRFELEDVKVSRLRAPLPPIVESFGFRLSYMATSPGYKIPIYIDSLSFLPGAIEVELLATSYPKPPSAARERRLLEILHERALAAEL